MSNTNTLIYSLYCGGLYGTEKMALATLAHLPKDYHKILFCPKGIAAEKAEQLGIETHTFTNKFNYCSTALKTILKYKNIIIISTSVSHSIILTLLSFITFKKIKHFHIVHGGADEKSSYHSKKILGYLPITLIAVSNYVASKLVEYGNKKENIKVAENFLPETPTHNHQQLSRNWPPKNILLVARVDPIKRIDLLLKLLSKYPELNKFNFIVLGAGTELKKLQAESIINNLNITWTGYQSDVTPYYKQADLFLHLCPNEPFGLVILEAMAAGLPVIAPDSGGPSQIISHHKTGLLYKSTDIDSLADTLQQTVKSTRLEINHIIDKAYLDIKTKYHPVNGIKRYIKIF